MMKAEKLLLPENYAEICNLMPTTLCYIRLPHANMAITMALYPLFILINLFYILSFCLHISSPRSGSPSNFLTHTGRVRNTNQIYMVMHDCMCIWVCMMQCSTKIGFAGKHLAQRSVGRREVIVDRISDMHIIDCVDSTWWNLNICSAMEIVSAAFRYNGFDSFVCSMVRDPLMVYGLLAGYEYYQIALSNSSTCNIQHRYASYPHTNSLPHWGSLCSILEVYLTSSISL